MPRIYEGGLGFAQGFSQAVFSSSKVISLIGWADALLFW